MSRTVPWFLHQCKVQHSLNVAKKIKLGYVWIAHSKKNHNYRKAYFFLFLDVTVYTDCPTGDSQPARVLSVKERTV